MHQQNKTTTKKLTIKKYNSMKKIYPIFAMVLIALINAFSFVGLAITHNGICFYFLFIYWAVLILAFVLDDIENR